MKDIRPSTLMVKHLTSLVIFLTVLAAAACPALAHGGEHLTAQSAWHDWHYDPDILIPLILAAGIYAAGALRRRTAPRAAPWWRHALFLGGLAALYAALLSPVDPVAERLFFVHQIQHLLLRMIGPMLVVLAWPEGTLTAGLPGLLRRGLLAPAVAAGVVRAVFGWLSRPAINTLLFVAALYVWQIPVLHDAALLNDPIHYVMHVTMLAAGLLFWWRVFDRRPPPRGARYGVRLMMLWLAMLSNIVLGAVTALKHTVYYEAYDIAGRLYGMAPLTDEKIGGIIIWIPSSMMCLIAVIAVIHMWGRRETQLDARVTAEPAPVTAAELRQRKASGNRTLAFGIAGFAACVFCAAIVVGVLITMQNRAGGLADDGQLPRVHHAHAYVHAGHHRTVR